MDYTKQLYEWSKAIDEIAIGDFAPDNQLSGPMGLVSNRWDHIKDHATKVGKIDDLDIYEAPGQHGDLGPLYILHFNRPIGYLKPLKDGLYTIVKAVWIDPSFRGKGIIKKLYELLLDNGAYMKSDGEQTKDSQRLWLSFFPKYKIELANHKDTKEVSSRKEMLQAYDPKSIWDRLLASRK